ncbi:MAG TPA: type II toxin-antitoxin system HipA family toxin [Candidatus Fermentibacter daniensis]|jgi:serine/threonine-protein kinase HipA|nr:MAG: hypothetical protein AO396_04575 [Candidatus Fermentibacter daniensis]MBP7719824.1 type II toxin-antitoxin system HipA family toxin [Candidatus Fermentibacter sp.]KZD17567.1 MAG: hypothetical protein AO394_05060 [Candidatus Fermentibacter daniensis]KZD19190.1 MAG: hypothetical protein AO395_07895 [Candidatus Fermentibacter daniensis]MCC6871231.1 type II toxin-antitoxin system HipA family toxin [Candidatus Fermentibacter sp.]
MSLDSLNVFFEQRLVGRIHSDSRGMMLFEYAREWLDSEERFPISRSLPLDGPPLPSERSHAFFANLLPEGMVREAVSRKLGISGGNDFALLRAIGGECAGALWIGPGQPPVDSPDRYEPIDAVELGRLAYTYGAMAGVMAPGVRLSLAGAQDKIPIAVRDGAFALPLDGAPSSHILKFENRDYADLPLNECLASELARRCGLPVVQTTLVDLGGIKACLVERYDRITVSGRMVRLHQEDFCQALGLPSAMKYEADGGPSFRQCFTLVQEASEEPLPDEELLLRWQIMNLLLGNADGHAKNLSLLHGLDGSVRLAPFYDMVSTLAYPGLSRDAALKIGEASDLGGAGPKHFDKLSMDCGLGARWVRSVVLDTAETLCGIIERSIDELATAYRQEQAVRRLLRIVSRQAANVRNAFSQARSG